MKEWFMLRKRRKWVIFPHYVSQRVWESSKINCGFSYRIKNWTSSEWLFMQNTRTCLLLVSQIDDDVVKGRALILNNMMIHQKCMKAYSDRISFGPERKIPSHSPLRTFDGFHFYFIFSAESFHDDTEFWIWWKRVSLWHNLRFVLLIRKRIYTWNKIFWKLLKFESSKCPQFFIRIDENKYCEQWRRYFFLLSFPIFIESISSITTICQSKTAREEKLTPLIFPFFDNKSRFLIFSFFPPFLGHKFMTHDWLKLLQSCVEMWVKESERRRK